MRFEQAEEGMQFALPARRSIVSTIGGAFWILFSGFWIVYDRKPSGGGVLLLPWVVVGPVVFIMLLRQVAGRELVTLTLGALTIDRNVFGIGFTRRYDAAQITNLRVAPPVPTWNEPRRNWGAFDHGMIAFEYGAKTVRFGAGVDEAEAAIIVAEIKRHYALT